MGHTLCSSLLLCKNIPIHKKRSFLLLISWNKRGWEKERLWEQSWCVTLDCLFKKAMQDKADPVLWMATWVGKINTLGISRIGHWSLQEKVLFLPCNKTYISQNGWMLAPLISFALFTDLENAKILWPIIQPSWPQTLNVICLPVSSLQQV